MSTRKRCFDREGVYLVDTFYDGNSQGTTAYVPVQWTGEDVILDRESQEKTLNNLMRGMRGGPGFSLYELGTQLPSDLVESLLEGLEQGRERTPLALLRFVEDPRVRPALAEAVRQCHLHRISTFAAALGAVGGPEALSILRERLEEGLESVEQRAEGLCGDPLASNIKSIAGALLDLDPDALGAAKVLVQLFEHSDFFVRLWAVQRAVGVYRGLRTEAMLTIIHGLQRLMEESSEPQLFLNAAPVLARLKFDVVLARCERILNGEDLSLRGDAVSALLRLPGPRTAEALAVLVRWIPAGEPFSQALRAAGFVRPLLSEETIAGVARRGLSSESPLLRYETVAFVRKVESESVRALLVEAVQEEPDPYVRRKMEGEIARLDGRP